MKTSRTIAMVIAVSSSVIGLTACGNLFGKNKNGGGPPPASMDLNIGAMTSAGCLNLAAVFDQLAAAPQDMVVRHYTKEFEIRQREGQPFRRSFAARTAKGKFKFIEQPVGAYLGQLPKVSQSACESVTFHYGEIEGAATLKASATENVSQLKLTRDDGQEWIYEIKGSREIEIKIADSVQDECPNHPTFPTHTASVNESMTWGPASELSQRQAAVSREYLKTMRMAVSQMPMGLSSLIIYEATPTVLAQSVDLKALASIGIDSDVSRCPDRGGTAPSGEEPPAPREPVATPTPAPAV